MVRNLKREKNRIKELVRFALTLRASRNLSNPHSSLFSPHVERKIFVALSHFLSLSATMIMLLVKYVEKTAHGCLARLASRL